jgi:hypothetical protein
MEHLGEGFEEHEIEGDMANVIPSESEFTSELGKAA